MKRFLLVIILAAVSAGSAFGQCSNADRQALEAWDKALGEASRTGNRAFMESAHADEFRSLSPSGVMLTKAQSIENAIQDSERNRTNPQLAPNLKYDFYDITCSGNTAVISHRNVATIKQSDGKEETQYSRALHFMEKRGATWVVVSSAGHPLNDFAKLAYLEREWNEASKNNDVAWFERNYAADATDVYGRTGAIYNKEEVIADVKSSKITLDSLELSDLRVRIEGNTALVTGINSSKGRDEKGQPFERRSRFTDVFVKRDGRWLVLATQGTVIAPPASPSPATTAQKQ
jgi:ketosteroid isomerase-like protein